MNTYAYVGGNPLNYSDPLGLEAFPMSPVAPGAYGGLAPIGAYAPGTPLHDLFVSSTTRLLNNIGEACRNYSQTVDPLFDLLRQFILYNESSSNDDNSNPYNGPVNDGVIVVDPNGNAIPVDPGESLTGSPDGRWTQVRDPDGNPTGVRIDGGHPKTHDDPRAQGPHAHIPGVANPDGTPWLPVR